MTIVAPIRGVWIEKKKTGRVQYAPARKNCCY